MMRIVVTFAFLFVFMAGFSQSFIKNTSNKALSFKDIQLQFDQFKKTTDLSQQKHWKNFKRYESEMQLHTNGRGEPDGFAGYIQAALEVAAQKQSEESQANLWYPVGPNAIPTNLTGYMENGIGRINCVAFHPTNTAVYYVGVAQGGLWKTSNGGASYTPLTDNLPITRISDICIDPNNTNTMYISVCDFEYIGFGLYLNGRKRNTHYGLGVYKTTDGGLSWNATGLTFQLTNGDASLLRKIVINPANSNELVACGVSGMYKSTNGGNSWTQKMDSLFWDMVQDPVNPNVLYAASGWVKNSNLGSAGIYKSIDFGTTWTLLTTGMTLQGVVQRIKLAIAPSDNNYVYALCCDNTDGFYGVYQSTNAGSSWTYKAPVLNILENGQGNGSGGQGPYDMALCVSATNKNEIYTGGINLWGSSDGGSTFNPISHWTLQYGNTIHGDIHYIDRQPGSSNIFVCSDGGIYKTSSMQMGTWGTSWPTVWTNLSNGMQVSSFYRLSSSKSTAGRLLAGAQDNASFYFNGSTWSTIFGGDGMDNYLNPVNNLGLVGSSQYGTLYYSNNGGISGAFVGSNINNESSEWVTPIVADYNHPGVLYAGNENVVKSVNSGQNWTPLASIYTNPGLQLNTEISALAVSNTNSNVIYAARRVRYELNLKGIIFRTVDGGATFNNITSNLPDTLYYTGIEVSPSDANEAVLCMAGFTSGCKVFKTTNGGQSWANISYNLPNIPVNCIKYVPVSGKLMVACDLGIYILDGGTNSWNSYSTGLPNVIITDIEFNPALNKAYVSSFGRGIWQTDLSMITGIDKINQKKPVNFSVYPSINKGAFTVRTEKTDGAASIAVIDVTGRVVYQSSLVDVETRIELPLIAGVYYIKLQNEKGLGVRKMLVEN